MGTNSIICQALHLNNIGGMKIAWTFCLILSLSIATEAIRLLTNEQQRQIYNILQQYRSVSRTAASCRDVITAGPETKVTTLKNGFRVATENNGLPTATVGLWLDAGSRYETDKTNGVAHFLEHMLYKGTNKRSQQQLESEVESLGAQVNSYTGRQVSALYAKCLAADMDKSVDILADMFLNSKLSDESMDAQRDVILRELDDAQSDIEGLVFDHAHTHAFQQTPLANSKFGPTKNIQSFKRSDLLNYIKAHCVAPRVVLVASGGVNHDKMVDLAEKYFGNMPWQQLEMLDADKPCRFTGGDIRHRNDYAPYCYSLMAIETCGLEDVESTPLLMGSMLLGQWDRTQSAGVNTTSRLANKLGWGHECVGFKAFTNFYRNTGLWGTYVVNDPFVCREVGEIVQHEWRYLCQKITDDEVYRAANMLRTHLFSSFDDTTASANDIGSQIVTHGRRISLQEWENRINGVDRDKFEEVLNKYIYDRDLVLAAYGMSEGLDDYFTLRARMSWWRM